MPRTNRANSTLPGSFPTSSSSSEDREAASSRPDSHRSRAQPANPRRRRLTTNEIAQAVDERPRDPRVIETEREIFRRPRAESSRHRPAPRPFVERSGLYEETPGGRILDLRRGPSHRSSGFTEDMTVGTVLDPQRPPPSRQSYRRNSGFFEDMMGGMVLEPLRLGISVPPSSRSTRRHDDLAPHRQRHRDSVSRSTQTSPPQPPTLRRASNRVTYAFHQVSSTLRGRREGSRPHGRSDGYTSLISSRDSPDHSDSPREEYRPVYDSDEADREWIESMAEGSNRRTGCDGLVSSLQSHELE